MSRKDELLALAKRWWNRKAIAARREALLDAAMIADRNAFAVNPLLGPEQNSARIAMQIRALAATEQ